METVPDALLWWLCGGMFALGLLWVGVMELTAWAVRKWGVWAR